ISIRLDRLVSRVLFALFGLVLLPALGPFRSYEPGVWCGFGSNGITDERACYAEPNALSENIIAQKWKEHGYVREFKKVAHREKSNVVLFHLVGMAPYGDVPSKHVLETWSLTEPLLARLTFVGEKFRPGHFPRPIPAGYAASLRSGN